MAASSLIKIHSNLKLSEWYSKHKKNKRLNNPLGIGVLLWTVSLEIWLQHTPLCSHLNIYIQQGFVIHSTLHSILKMIRRVNTTWCILSWHNTIIRNVTTLYFVFYADLHMHHPRLGQGHFHVKIHCSLLRSKQMLLFLSNIIYKRGKKTLILHKSMGFGMNHYGSPSPGHLSLLIKKIAEDLLTPKLWAPLQVHTCELMTYAIYYCWYNSD